MHRRRRLLIMSTEGRGITWVSIPVCDSDSLSATLCAREDGATAVFGDARQTRRESTRQMRRGLVQGLGFSTGRNMAEAS